MSRKYEVPVMDKDGDTYQEEVIFDDDKKVVSFRYSDFYIPYDTIEQLYNQLKDNEKYGKSE